MFQEKRDVLLETVNYCNLRCPACPWHSTMTREKRSLRPEEFNQIFKHISPFSRSIFFYVMGEPLLNEHIFQYVKTAHDAGIYTGFSTNGMLLGEHIDDVFSSGLDFIQIALDGLEPQTHEYYRVGSDYNRIVSNLRCLITEKEKRNSRSPEIQIQTLISRQNENQIMDFQALADELGVGFSAKKMMFGKTEDEINRNRPLFEPEQKKYRRLDNPDMTYYKDMSVCPQSKYITILCNGDVIPCCYDYDGTEILGNLLYQTWTEIVRGNAKKEFDRKRRLGNTTLCLACDLAMEKQKQLPSAILFDYGRTLVIMPDIDIRKGIADLLDALDVKHDQEIVEKYYEEREKFITQMCPEKKRRMTYPETKVMKHLFELFHIETQKNEKELEQLFSAGCSIGKPVDGSVEFLRTIRSLGIATGVVTNNCYSEETVRWILKKLYPEHEFDVILSSADEGCHKPDRKIFEKALFKLCIEPDKAWFVGDGIEDDIKGAYSVGMESFWYVKYAKLGESKINHREDCKVIREWKELEEILVECVGNKEEGR